MIVLVNPMLSRTSINSDSCYVVISQFIRETARVRPDVMFDVFWPSNGKDWTYYRDGLFDLPTVRRIPMRFHPMKMKQVLTYDPWAIATALDYKYAIDVVWNHVVELGDILRNQIATYNQGSKSIVVNAHHYVLHHTLPYPVDHDQAHVQWRQLVGSTHVDANVFDSLHCRDMFFDNASRLMAPSVVEEIRATCVDIPHGTLDVAEFARAIDNAPPKSDVVTFAYNHRLQNYKNYKDTFPLFQELWDEGLKFRVVVFGSPTDEANMSYVSKFPFVDVFISETRAEYLAMLSTCDANTLNSQHETFCIAAVESMAFGQPLIAPDAVTFPEITGHAAGNGYGLLFRSLADQKDVLRRVITDTDFRRHWGHVAHDHVWSTYAVTDWVARYLALFDAHTSSVDILAQLKRPEGLVALIRSRPLWDVQDLRRAVYGSYADGRLLGSSQSFPTTKIVRLARQLGYRDTRDPRTRALCLVHDNGNSHVAASSS